MSLLGVSEIDGDAGILVNFNQNNSSLAVATKSGYSLYTLSTIDSALNKIYSCPEEDIYVLERLFESSLVAMVTQRGPRKLKVCHFKKQSEICNYSYSNTIVAVKLNRERLVVCLEESLYIHNIQDMKVVHTIRDTPSNINGICALSCASENCYLAYPGSVTSGEVQIFDAINLNAKAMIPAHDSPLAALAFSPSGTEIATASERGTVIRVFSSLDGTKLFELRRGLKRCVSIGSLSFSTCAQYLVSSSNTETVHIFRLDRTAVDNPEAKPPADDWMGYISKTVTSYLPTQVTDVFSQGRAFASVSLPEPGIRRICAIDTIQKQLRLMIASQDGYLYVYSIPTAEGGECQLVKKYNLRLDDTYQIDVKVDSPQPLGGGSVDDVAGAAAASNVTVSGAAAGGAKSSSSGGGPSYASALKNDENPST